MKIETREVLAAAYLRGHKGAMLSHAVLVDDKDYAVSMLCTRVKFESLADRGASDPNAEPTCNRCYLRKHELLRKAPEGSHERQER